MIRYPLDAHRAALGPLTKEPDACTCTPVNPRHVSPWHCVPQEDIDAWRARSGCGPKAARELYWLDREFGGG